jgi:transcriptional regulator GlxA family with amidase domain
MENPETLSFTRHISGCCEVIASVCTGALILAAVGLLDGKRATNHWAALDELRCFPHVFVEHQRYIHEGKIITSSGDSAGIDMALYLVELLHGPDVCNEVAHRME